MHSWSQLLSAGRIVHAPNCTNMLSKRNSDHIYNYDIVPCVNVPELWQKNTVQPYFTVCSASNASRGPQTTPCTANYPLPVRSRIGRVLIDTSRLWCRRNETVSVVNSVDVGISMEEHVKEQNKKIWDFDMPLQSYTFLGSIPPAVHICISKWSQYIGYLI